MTFLFFKKSVTAFLVEHLVWKKRTLFVVSASSCVIMFSFFDLYDPTVPQQFFRELLNVTNTTFSRILNKHWAQTEGDVTSSDVVINVLFFLPLTSVDSCGCDSYCSGRFFQNLPAPLKHYGVFDVLPIFKVFANRKKIRVALGRLRCWQILTAKSINFRKNLPSATHAYAAMDIFLSVWKKTFL